MIFDEIAARKLSLFPDRHCFVYLSFRSWTEREDPGSEIRITKEGTPISFKVFIRLIFFCNPEYLQFIICQSVEYH